MDKDADTRADGWSCILSESISPGGEFANGDIQFVGKFTVDVDGEHVEVVVTRRLPSGYSPRLAADEMRAMVRRM